MIKPIIFIPNNYYNEKWNQIPATNDGIKPYYMISTYGNVYSNYSNTMINPHLTDTGYLQVSLMTDTGRVFRKVHRLMLITYNPIENSELFDCNHKDGNKLNNCIWNLEWCTKKENIRHAIENNLRREFKGENNPNFKISETGAKRIGELLMLGYSDNDIINIVENSNKSIISDIATGRTWSYLFSTDELKLLQATRRGSYISIEDKHKICKYYQEHNYVFEGYGKVSNLARKALEMIGLELSNRNIAIAKRLYYRYDNPEITSNYDY